MSPPRMDNLSWALLAALSVVWGASFFFGKVALSAVPPMTLVTLRVAIAAAALLVVMRLAGRPIPLDRRSLLLFAALGLFNNAVPYTLLFWGQTRIDSGLASILNAMTPISTILVAHVLTADEKLSAGKLAGTLLGVAGVALLVGPDVLGKAGAELVAELACLAATVSYGLAATLGRRLKGTDPMATAAGQLVASTMLMLPLALFVDGVPGALPPAGVLAAIGALALVSTAFAYILYFTVISRAGATNAALVTLLVPVTAILLGAAFLGERLHAGAFAGMALIGLGLLVIDGRIVGGILPRRERRGSVT